ncbi:protein of unknown function [Burkholderia multivorans]
MSPPTLIRLDPAPGTPGDDQLLALASGVERYEVAHVLDLPAGRWWRSTAGALKYRSPREFRRSLDSAILSVTLCPALQGQRQLGDALGGGVTRSLALDAYGKSMSTALLDIDVSEPPEIE